MKNKLFAISLLIYSCAIPSTNVEYLPQFSEMELFNSLSDKKALYEDVNEKILFPIRGALIPNNPNLLPNAERKYRNGIHKGVDIVVPFMTPVYASLDGVIVVANTEYQDVDLLTYERFLKTTDLIQKTPSDIYHHILLGKHIVIDHGFGFLQGYRTTSTYAHLEKINNISVGDFVNKGDLIGYVGNSGTKFGAQNNTLGAHLHWEVHFENETNKYYLGENITTKDFLRLTKKLFKGDNNEDN